MKPKYDMRSVSLSYNGQLFKSKLEAKWAFMFDYFGWTWGYESTKINGRVPDFMLVGDPSTSSLK